MLRDYFPTRDNVIYTLIIVVAIGTYLAGMPPPTQWTWGEWMASMSALAAIGAGKLSNSPQPSTAERTVTNLVKAQEKKDTP